MQAGRGGGVISNLQSQAVVFNMTSIFDLLVFNFNKIFSINSGSRQKEC
jgi:hypothetical protein